MGTTITVKTSFEGVHCWPDAPEDVKFLSFPHRHVFHVSVVLDVMHNDRDVEFFEFKAILDRFLAKLCATYNPSTPRLRDLGSMSCEQLAIKIHDFIYYAVGGVSVNCVSVFEDEENGATYRPS